MNKIIFSHLANLNMSTLGCLAGKINRAISGHSVHGNKSLSPVVSILDISVDEFCTLHHTRLPVWESRAYLLGNFPDKLTSECYLTWENGDKYPIALTREEAIKYKVHQFERIPDYIIACVLHDESLISLGTLITVLEE